MGGCRCTYRNCSSRTDGKTHMFHYPVFDKVRCHQWLTNAHKLEFLNLKVSQLKNRVVCQHHFKDENFMNFKKDKLTFDAVPTEDGPYCDSSQSDETKTEQDDTKVFSISLDDIENEYLTIVDKKANFSVKYGDFLTNCDLMDLDSLNSLNQICDSNQIAIKGLSEYDPILNVSNNQVLSTRPVKSVQPLRRSNRGKCFGKSSKSILNNTPSSKNKTIQDFTIPHNDTVNISKQCETQQTEEDQNSMSIILNVSHVPVEFLGTKSNNQNQQNIDRKIDAKVLDESKPFNENAARSSLKESKKIRIISEKKNVDPVSLIGKLEPVSPTRILTFPNKRQFFNPNPVEITEIPVVPNNNIREIPIINMDPLKDNIVLEKSGSEPMNIISCRKDNVPQKFRSDVNNTIINEALLNNVSSQEVKSDVISKLPNEVLLNVSSQQVKSDVINTLPNEVLHNNVSSQKLRSDVINTLPNEVLHNDVSSQKLRSDIINTRPNEVLHNNVSSQKLRSDVINKMPYDVLSNTSLLKSKIPPERVAAIAEKRKFNMKLRDIIEDCLDNLDEPDKSDYDKRKLSHNTKIMQSKKQQVGSYLAKDPELPSVKDYTIAYLEARMKKMENNLLNKIEENSQKIVDLKQTYYARSCDKKTVHTQTSVSEDVHKRQLYQELSKYLSQEANSLIYEELFINKYLPKCSSSPKRRKRRR